MLINELAQWAMLAFIGVFVLGLTRQLGSFLAPPKEETEITTGPDLGRPLPKEVLRPAERKLLARLMRERHAPGAAIVVVDAECPGCHDMIERLLEADAPDRPPVVALSRLSDDEHRRLLDRAADLVIVDPERLKRARLDITPFVLVVDESLEVAHKQLTPDVEDAFERWLAMRAASNGAPEAPDEVAELKVVHQASGGANE